mmetsp:Transcript_7366/g.18736  ORF Transcript_7366/g.18736 Transcript_7366/m.18736 type:complete len:330 (-) Transcript_7366:1162-2151(-)
MRARLDGGHGRPVLGVHRHRSGHVDGLAIPQGDALDAVKPREAAQVGAAEVLNGDGHVLAVLARGAQHGSRQLQRRLQRLRHAHLGARLLQLDAVLDVVRAHVHLHVGVVLVEAPHRTVVRPRGVQAHHGARRLGGAHGVQHSGGPRIAEKYGHLRRAPRAHRLGVHVQRHKGDELLAQHVRDHAPRAPEPGDDHVPRHVIHLALLGLQAGHALVALHDGLQLLPQVGQHGRCRHRQHHRQVNLVHHVGSEQPIAHGEAEGDERELAAGRDIHAGAQGFLERQAPQGPRHRHHRHLAENDGAHDEQHVSELSKEHRWVDLHAHRHEEQP